MSFILRYKLHSYEIWPFFRGVRTRLTSNDLEIIFFFLTFWPLSFIGISYKRHCSGNGLRLFNFDLILWNLLERYKSKLSRYKPFSGFFYFSNFFWRYKPKINWYKWFRHRVKNTVYNMGEVYFLFSKYGSPKKKKKGLQFSLWSEIFFWFHRSNLIMSTRIPEILGTSVFSWGSFRHTPL